jgi:hypothetical protein
MATQFIYDMSQTWNDGGTTFDAVKMNVTNTASAAASKLVNIQMGGTDQFVVYRAKQTSLTVADTTSHAAAAVFATTRIIIDGSSTQRLQMGAAVALGWGGAFAQTLADSLDTALFRNTAGIIESNSGGAIGTGGIVPGERFATTQVVTALTNNIATAQNVFAAANDVLTLAAATTYFFEFQYFINTGTTTHTTATEFTASSAFTSINYLAELWSTTAGTISTTAPSVLDVNVSTAVVLNATSVAPRTTIRGRGIIRTNAATTVTPKITFSAGPTGTCEVAVNSYFRCYPVGSNTVAAVGAWA